jgi:predicted MPP superfamily phosphohydrolase
VNIEKNNYTINSINKDIGKIKIMMFSDIQYKRNFCLNKLNYIVKKAKKKTPDYICIPGDLIDNSCVVNSALDREILIDWLRYLSEVAKVIISIGNHDIMHKVDNKWQLHINEEWFSDINKLSNVVLLRNSIYEDNKCRFIGFNPSFEHYEKDKEEVISFLIELNEAFPNIVDNDLYNIMLCHTPTNIFKNDVIKYSPVLKNVDLVFSGHIHGGLTLPLIRKYLGNNQGFIDPNGRFFPDIAHGIIEKSNLTGVISTGVTKLGESTGLLEKLNFLFPMNINYIEIENDIKTKKF